MRRRRNDHKSWKPPRGPQASPKGSAQKSARARERQRGKHSAGRLFEKLVALQGRLRGPSGCPWDSEQTPQTLRTFLVEETYEVLDALDAGDASQLAGELGDLLLQIVFHALMAQEAGLFDICDVIENVHDKMVERHPHVFGKAKARTAADVLRNWEQAKAEERKRISASKRGSQTNRVQKSLLDGIPKSLPGVLEAAKLTRRAAHIGFDWENIEGVLEKVREESAELVAASGGGDFSRGPSVQLEEEVGDLLFAAVNAARFLGVDPEIALKKANRKFSRRFRWMESEARRRGGILADVPRSEMEVLWERAKTVESRAAENREKGSRSRSVP